MRPRRHHHRHHHHGRTLRGTLMRAFVAAVVITGAIVSGMFFVGGGERGSFMDEMTRLARFTASNLARADDVAAAGVILHDTSAAFAVRLVLKDAGAVVAEAGVGECRRPIVVDVVDGTEGVEPRHPHWSLDACRPQVARPPARAIFAVVAVIAVLAALSSAVARRIARPLRILADTARRIGEGDLSARAPLSPRAFAEVKQVSAALAEMAERIERELSGQRALLAGASHELRTPLGHLRLLIETAREKLQAAALDDAHVVHLDEMEREVIELDSLLEKLLAQARLDFARVDRRPTDLAELCKRAMQLVSVDASRLSTGSVSPIVNGDATLLLRAISNLLENANHHGGGVVGVRIDLVEERGIARVIVEDAGSGVAEGDRERIFEPFVNRDDRGKGSLGLGLHLVRRIAEAHGGSVTIADDDRPGARFVLTLPLA